MFIFNRKYIFIRLVNFPASHVVVASFFFGGGMIFWGGNHIPLLSRTSNSNSQLQVARLAVAGDLLASAVAGDQVARSFCSCSRWFWENMFFFFSFIFRLCVCLWVSWCHSLLLGDQNAVCTEHLVTLMWKYIASVLGPPGTSEQRCHEETELPFVGFVPRIESCCM